MLGRVLGFEYSIARTTEAVISFSTGRLEDHGYGKHVIASLSACVGSIMLAFWSSYHIYGGGAAKKQFNKTPSDKELNEFELRAKGENNELV